MATITVGNLEFAIADSWARDYLLRVHDIMKDGGGWLYFTGGVMKHTVVWVAPSIPVHFQFKEPQEFEEKLGIYLA